MNLPRVGIICDFVEENWISMDLAGDMLLKTSPNVTPRSSGRSASVRQWRNGSAMSRCSRGVGLHSTQIVMGWGAIQEVSQGHGRR